MPATPDVGIGWRQPHYEAVLAERPPVSFLEVHSENFFGDGGAALAVLQQAREAYPISLHGVGLSLGSAIGLDETHLARLARLVRCIDPVRVSDHASFARAPFGPVGAQGQPVHAGDLLPLAFTEASLRVMVSNVQKVQDTIRRPILVENLSAYLRWADDAMAEPEFFNELARRSGCGMLLDVNNLVVNALNAGQAPVATACAFIDALHPDIVGEIHLAGFSEQAGLIVDDHGSRVRPEVWRVYAHAVRRLGVAPSLIEWDTNLPTLEVLLSEAAAAQAHLLGVDTPAVRAKAVA
ncbi:MAG: DUF692 domain-containing protein [Ideonella sp.]|nr:DUF692 domain-containing protein [Ideonella sp.]